MAEIYIIENKINGKQYVGKTKHSCLKRWRSHLADCKSDNKNRKLYNAIKKHGAENFEVYTMEDCNEYKLNERECYWIEVLEPEYNMTKGGDGGRTWQGIVKKTWSLSKEARENISRGVRKRFANGYRYSHYDSLKNIYNKGVKRFWLTPWGSFTSSARAAKSARTLKKLGINEVISDPHTIKKYCENPSFVFSTKAPAAWKGKTAKELGFGFREKNRVH